jgi:peptidoglycan-N-acetylglucosamine deacetylase
MRSTISNHDHRTHASASTSERAPTPPSVHACQPAIEVGRALGGLRAVAMGGYLLPALSIYSPALRRALGVESATASARGYALTFDDGPHAQGTPATLEILAGAKVTATFFLVGEQVQRNPGLVAEILAAGHQIGLHCDRHRNLLRLAPRQVRTDIERARDRIESAAGCAVGLYRPPYGILNATALRIARAHGWRTLLWSRWGKDWQARATPASIAARVTDGAGEGSVLLLHDADDYSAPGSWRRTVAALPRILDTLGRRGLEPVLP